MRNRYMYAPIAIITSLFIGLFASPSNAAEEEKTVVVYAALDEEFSKPILEAFKEKTGIEVKMVFDTESSKSVGLTNRLIAEQKRPRCDVFWNNEPVNTIRLKEAGVLQSYESPVAKDFPKAFKDPSGTWIGFAARARVLIVNTDLVPEDKMPLYLDDLIKDEWKGKIGIAKPLAGSTATWVTALHEQQVKSGRPMPEASAPPAKPETALEALTAVVANGVRVLGGNKQAALAVSGGTLPMAFTDTDDAIVEVESGKPVKLIYFRNGLRGDDNAGVMFFPNTLSLVKDSPHPENAKKLIDFLLSPEVEILLAKSASAQIPVNPVIKEGEDYKPRSQTPSDVPPMEADWDAVAKDWDAARTWIKANVK